MGWELEAAVILIGAYAAVRSFLRLIDTEYAAALATRRVVNLSRKRSAAKIKARLKALQEKQQAGKA